ncbi:MAG: GrdX protein, partial [Fretibacterium sp.]|nr:GrdX protein [Fretibacterium sp.]
MENDVVLYTNNEALASCVKNGRFVRGSSFDVLVAVRDSIHLGSRLLTHPLCGNLRPYQQPFRSILLRELPGEPTDLESLSMIENAVVIYKSCEERLILPENLDEYKFADYAFIDGELMKESLERYGLLASSSFMVPAPLLCLQ